jgi:hypothetical protein
LVIIAGELLGGGHPYLGKEATQVRAGNLKPVFDKSLGSLYKKKAQPESGSEKLTGSIQSRCRELMIQICDAEDVRILKGVVSNDHIHIEYPPRVSVSDLVKRLTGRTSKRLQDEFSDLKKRYWSRHFWAIGYGV